MKTPEELAEEYADQDEVACDAINHAAEHLVKNAFLAGYQAREKQERLQMAERYSHDSPLQVIAAEYVKRRGTTGPMAAYEENRFIDGYQAAQPQWISVKEQLPEEHKWVLGYYSRYEHQEQFVVGLVKRFVHSWAGANIWLTDIQDSAISYEEVYSISHWMPLPEAPKEGR